MKQILFIIAHEGFQPIEYYAAKAVLETGEQKILTASDGEGEASPAYDGAPAKIDASVTDAKAVDYDGVFVVGGPGAIDHLDNENVYRLVREAAENGLLYGAICIATRILSHAGVLKGKKATGWDGDNELGGIIEAGGGEYVREPVVTDGKMVTATGPKAAEEWGKAILRLC
ncbi:MAG: DJ-1/PfpI family protein [Candidatus Magasanikbacteria bacterium]|nr:DJ-1/PfpI family protein [Candidatus Magasanikbacteria bacterium]